MSLPGSKQTGAAARKILLVFGTRPEAIKMAPVVRELRKYPEQFQVRVCVTAQHREMLDQVLEIFGIETDHDLDLMRPGQDLYEVTAGVLLGMRGVIAEARPDLVLVHGDTTTTMAASLAAFYAGVPVGHVEAGLRTFNKLAPFPEEINRRVTGCIGDLHFAPTYQARRNLLAEGVTDSAILITGNTVIDALFLALEKIECAGLAAGFERDLVGKYPGMAAVFPEMGGSRSSNVGTGSSHEARMILVTGHRRENFGSGFENISLALHDIAAAHPEMAIVYPVHLNPNVQEPVRRILGNSGLGNIHLIEPVDYLPFVWLMVRSKLIITDSGGVQEEAPSLGKPVLVMRETTERPEAVEAGTVRLVGTDRSRIFAATSELLADDAAYDRMAKAHNPYGDGKAAARIRERLTTGGTA